MRSKGTIRSALTPRFAVALAAVGLVSVVVGISLVGGAGATAHPSDEESAAVQPTSEPVEVASGTTADGNSWNAVRYDTAGGLICIDVNVTGPATNGVTQSAGGCFDREAPLTQRGRAMIGDGATTVAFGVLEGASRAASNSDRGLLIEFNSGEVVRPAVEADGVFVGAGAGLPLTLEYRSSAGDAWRHAFGDGRPRG